MKCNCDTQSRIVDCVFCFIALLTFHIILTFNYLIKAHHILKPGFRTGYYRKLTSVFS